MAGPMEMAAVGLHIVQVECDLCVVEFNLGRRELRAGEFHPGHSKLGRRSTRCVRAASAPSVRCKLRGWEHELCVSRALLRQFFKK